MFCIKISKKKYLGAPEEKNQLYDQFGTSYVSNIAHNNKVYNDLNQQKHNEQNLVNRQSSSLFNESNKPVYLNKRKVPKSYQIESKIRKKRRHESLKDEDYDKCEQRRLRNNLACRESRQRKKQKNIEINEKKDLLVAENSFLLAQYNSLMEKRSLLLNELVRFLDNNPYNSHLPVYQQARQFVNQFH